MKDTGVKLWGKTRGDGFVTFQPCQERDIHVAFVLGWRLGWAAKCWCPDSLPNLLDLGLAFISGFVVELRGVQSIELSTRLAVDVIPVCGRGLGLHQGMILLVTNFLPCMFVPLLVELPCFCQALEYGFPEHEQSIPSDLKAIAKHSCLFLPFSSFSLFWCHTKTLVWSREVCDKTLFNLFFAECGQLAH